MKSVDFSLGSEKRYVLKQRRDLITLLFKKGDHGSQWRGLSFLYISGQKNDQKAVVVVMDGKDCPAGNLRRESVSNWKDEEEEGIWEEADGGGALFEREEWTRGRMGANEDHLGLADFDASLRWRCPVGNGM